MDNFWPTKINFHVTLKYEAQIKYKQYIQYNRVNKIIE